MNNCGVYETATRILPGKGQLEGERLEENLFNRHYEFVYGLETTAGERTIMSYYNKKWPVMKGIRAAMYCNIIRCLNLREVKGLGPHKGHYNTSWRVALKDIRGYMAEESNRQDLLARNFLQQQAPVSKPLGLIIGRTREESAVLILYRENEKWQAILKFPKVKSEYKPSNLVFFVLKYLKINHVRVIPGIKDNLADRFSDEIKECYEIIASLFDEPSKIELWKRENALPEHVFNVNRKRNNF